MNKFTCKPEGFVVVGLIYYVVIQAVQYKPGLSLGEKGLNDILIFPPVEYCAYLCLLFRFYKRNFLNKKHFKFNLRAVTKDTGSPKSLEKFSRFFCISRFGYLDLCKNIPENIKQEYKSSTFFNTSTSNID